MAVNEVLKTIKSRRSIRRFRSDAVDDRTLETLLDAARWAPSAGNLQPWRFYVVRDPDRRLALAAAAGQRFVGEAPAVIVVCARPGDSARHYGERGRSLYCLQDTAAAIQNILLAAASLGLGSCWVGAFNEAAVARALDISSDDRPVALLPVGYPAVEPRPIGRRSIQEVSTWM